MQRSNKTRLTAVLLLLFCVLLLAVESRYSVPSSTDLQGRASSYFTDETGTRAAYLVLQQTLPAVEVMRRPLYMLDDPSSGPSTLLVTSPMLNLSPREADSLDAWLQAGGQLILALKKPWSIRKTGKKAEDEENEKFPFGIPGGLESGPSYLERHGMGDEDATTMVGRGRIVVISDGLAFSNDTLRADPDAAVRLTNLCFSWGNGKALIDEYHQGFGDRRSLYAVIGLFLRTPWGLMILQLLIAGAILMFGVRRRFGRVIEEPPLERSSAVDIVDARGGLFHAAAARMLALNAMHRHLNAQVATLAGRSGDLIDDTVRARLAGGDSALESDLAAYAKLFGDAIRNGGVANAELIQIGKLAGQIQGRLSDAGGGVRALRTAG